mmetsp:Transcript_44285/g.69254  ORF Transcript_44285/g.69254 Transcript_44285/m.69254 type:complete len:446 (+) Transcript_44285:1-1338(+)
MNPDGHWRRVDEPPVGEGDADELEKILDYAKTLPTREADEYLSQDMIQSILRSSMTNRQSKHLIQAALRETEDAGVAAPSGARDSANYRDLAADILVRVQRGDHGPDLPPPGLEDRSPDAVRAVASHGVPSYEESAFITSEIQGLFASDAKQAPGTSVLAIGGWDGTQNLSTVERLVQGGNRWELVSKMTTPRRGAAAVTVGSRVVVIGGWDGQGYLKTVEMFDSTTGKWQSLADMNQSRCYCGACEMDGKIYVVGGYYGQLNLDSAEVYDPETDQWSELPRLNHARRGLGLAMLSGRLYAIGGWDGKRNLSSVEAWSAITGEWRKMPELGTARSSVTVAVLQGRIYALGGWDGKRFLNSVECYEPIYGTAKNPIGEWRPAAPMNIPRSYAAAVCSANRLVVIGGWDGASGKRLDSVEAYEPGAEEWQFLPRLTCPRYAAAAVLV